MSRQQEIEASLKAKLSPLWLEVLNESHGHNVPAGSETHFKVTVVSAAFTGQRRVQRHQQVYTLLQSQMDAGLHALALHCHTPEEWEAIGQVPDSPACRGGMSRESKA